MTTQTDSRPTPALLVTVKEAARALAISRRMLFTLTQRGEIPAVRIGRSVRYDPEDLRRWIAERKGRAQ